MKFSSSFKVGILALTALLIFFCTVLWVKGRAFSSAARIEVQFKDVVKKFVLPGAIADGYLRINDEELVDFFKKKNDVHNRMLKAQVALRSNEFTSDRIKEEIEKIKEKS